MRRPATTAELAAGRAQRGAPAGCGRPGIPRHCGRRRAGGSTRRRRGSQPLRSMRLTRFRRPRARRASPARRRRRALRPACRRWEQGLGATRTPRPRALLSRGCRRPRGRTCRPGRRPRRHRAGVPLRRATKSEQWRRWESGAPGLPGLVLVGEPGGERLQDRLAVGAPFPLSPPAYCLGQLVDAPGHLLAVRAGREALDQLADLARLKAPAVAEHQHGATACAGARRTGRG